MKVFKTNIGLQLEVEAIADVDCSESEVSGDDGAVDGALLVRKTGRQRVEIDSFE